MFEDDDQQEEQCSTFWPLNCQPRFNARVFWSEIYINAAERNLFNNGLILFIFFFHKWSFFSNNLASRLLSSTVFHSGFFIHLKQKARGAVFHFLTIELPAKIQCGSFLNWSEIYIDAAERNLFNIFSSSNFFFLQIQHLFSPNLAGRWRSSARLFLFHFLNKLYVFFQQQFGS